jgi:uncharacterized protein (TIGR00251 family)
MGLFEEVRMLIIEVKVVPSSGKSGCILDKAGRLKCYLKSPPERNEANTELVKLFAKALKLTQNEVSIVAGATSRIKKLKIAKTMTEDELLAHLGIQRQLSVW